VKKGSKKRRWGKKAAFGKTGKAFSRSARERQKIETSNVDTLREGGESDRCSVLFQITGGRGDSSSIAITKWAVGTTRRKNQKKKRKEKI